MTLRRRLALTMLLTSIPLVAGWIVWNRKAQTQRLDDSLREFALAYMEAGGRERCERDPKRFRVDTLEDPPPHPPRDRHDPERRPPPPRRRDDDGHRRGPSPPGAFPFRRRPVPVRRGPVRPVPARGTQMWAYAAALTSANDRAPDMPAALAVPMADPAVSFAAADWQEGSRRGRQVAVRMPWTSEVCAVVLVRRPWAAPAGASRALLWGAVGLCLALLLAVLLAIGPIVRRIRHLTDAVEASARTDYRTAIDVQGSDEIGQLAKAFNDAGRDVRHHVERLEAREATLRAFVADTTHDVMIPLTVLQGHLSALRKARASGGAIDERAVHAALDESQYIASIVQNLSAVAKLEAGSALARHAVDLGALVERVVGRYRPLATSRGLTLDFGVPPDPIRSLGDVTLLEQAVSNLVHNAVRYNREGGRVALVLEESAGRFVLRVSDDGPGIPVDEIRHVTERNFRGSEARTRRPHGAGLGLHIVSDVAERHGFSFSLRAPSSGGLVAEIGGPLLPDAS